MRDTMASIRTRSFLALVLLLLPLDRVGGQHLLTPLDCRTTCVCASNIVSCSRSNMTSIPTPLPPYTAVLDLSFNAIARVRAGWTEVRLSRLHTLLLAHNGLTFLSSESFAYVTKLRYLDLSSNGLRILEELIFEPLEHLEVLLLYNNQISQIDRTAFSGLVSLQRLYLSRNQISRFPLELVKDRSRLETLVLLDVSSNKIKSLPLGELQALPAWIKNGLYFHRNPLPCSCDLYELVARWDLKDMNSVKDYPREHTCVLPGVEKERMAVLDLNKVYMNCSQVSLVDEESYLEQFLVLDCDPKKRNMKKTWVLPGNVPVPSGHKTAEVLPGGNLQIGPLTAEDTGVYTCYATSDAYNETLFVNVMVYNTTASGGFENLKTAYTTLVACVFSLIMVLIYLYLTPCSCCPGQDPEKDPDSVRSSEASIPQALDDPVKEAGGGGAGLDFTYRHMGPLDNKEQNGRLNPIGEEEEEWLEDGKDRRGSDAGSVSSVCSDTPMVL